LPGRYEGFVRFGDRFAVVMVGEFERSLGSSQPLPGLS
jgi:hypothetical protein